MDYQNQVYMKINPLRSDLVEYLRNHRLKNKFDKQIKLFSQNSRHPSLHTEILKPKHLKIYSFRIDQKYRAIFIILSSQVVEIVDINDHYQ